MTIVVSSCKKDVGILDQPAEPIPVASKGYFPLAVGNYWVYKKYTLDTLGNVLWGISLDTVKVLKDTVINSNIFYKISGSASINGTQSPYYCRDSSNYIIYPNGTKYCLTNFTDTIKVDTMMNEYVRCVMMAHHDSTIIVPAGSFKTNSLERRYYYMNIIPYGGNPQIESTIFGKEIGIIRENFWYSNAKWQMIGELISYKIN